MKREGFLAIYLYRLHVNILPALLFLPVRRGGSGLRICVAVVEFRGREASDRYYSWPA
jgi:hypothetical protein